MKKGEIILIQFPFTDLLDKKSGQLKNEEITLVNDNLKILFKL